MSRRNVLTGLLGIDGVTALARAEPAAAEVDLLADNPGKWIVRCHNAYHAEASMMTRLEYTYRDT